MKELYIEQIQQANLFLQENDLEKSIAHYEFAMRLTESAEQKIATGNLLGRLYQKTKNPEKAIAAFQNSIELYTQSEISELLPEKASILNNLAAVYLENDTQMAIENYKSGLDIYTKLNASGSLKYHPHMANTNFALAEAFLKKQDFYNAKSHFKTALKLYENLPDNSLNALKASAYYQLGNIFTDEFNLFDAQLNYSKSLAVYQILAAQDEKSYLPFLTAVLNNLGVTYKSMNELEKSLAYFKQVLANYENLVQSSSTMFLPFVAATTNSISIVFAEMKNFEEAIIHAHKTIAVYNELSDKNTEEFTHYLATALHNLGLFYFEKEDLNLAEKYFLQALSIRENLPANQVEFLDADICTTGLNLVELYQIKLERTTDLHYKNKALKLLEMVAERLDKQEDDRPVIKSMKSDCKYYADYFSQINLDELKIKSAFKDVDSLSDQILGTSIPKEKIIFQRKIVKILESLGEKISDNDKLKNELAYAYNDLAWIYLRINDPKNAQKILEKAKKLEQPIASLRCNLAHSFLLQGHFEIAKEIYFQLLPEKTIENQPYKKVILEDFEILKKDGISSDAFDKMKSLL